jgi:hypothetical protein
MNISDWLLITATVLGPILAVQAMDFRYDHVEQGHSPR